MLQHLAPEHPAQHRPRLGTSVRQAANAASSPALTSYMYDSHSRPRLRTFSISRCCTVGETNLSISPPSVAISRTNVLLMNWYLSLGVRNTVSTSGIKL